MLNYLCSYLVWVQNVTPTTNGLGHPNSSHVLIAACVRSVIVQGGNQSSQTNPVLHTLQRTIFAVYMWDTAHQCRKKKKTVTVETVLVTFSLTTGSNSSASCACKDQHSQSPMAHLSPSLSCCSFPDIQIGSPIFVHQRISRLPCKNFTVPRVKNYDTAKPKF